MPKHEAQNEAIRRSRETLAGVDVIRQADRVGLPPFDEDGAMRVRMFGRDMLFNAESLALTDAETRKEARPGDTILLLHYIEQDMPPAPAGELVSFRDFTGGQFYYEPFLSRTVKPLLGRFGNDLTALVCNLERFDTDVEFKKDVKAEIHAFGPLTITLIYRSGDDEFPASADVLFNRAVHRALCAEDAAVLASRVCIGLL